MSLNLLDSDCAIYAMLGLHSALRERLAQCEPGEVEADFADVPGLKTENWTLA